METKFQNKNTKNILQFVRNYGVYFLIVGFLPSVYFISNQMDNHNTTVQQEKVAQNKPFIIKELKNTYGIEVSTVSYSQKLAVDKDGKEYYIYWNHNGNLTNLLLLGNKTNYKTQVSTKVSGETFVGNGNGYGNTISKTRYHLQPDKDVVVVADASSAEMYFLPANEQGEYNNFEYSRFATEVKKIKTEK
jgi:hypothetical protein